MHTFSQVQPLYLSQEGELESLKVNSIETEKVGNRYVGNIRGNTWSVNLAGSSGEFERVGC